MLHMPISIPSPVLRRKPEGPLQSKTHRLQQLLLLLREKHVLRDDDLAPPDDNLPQVQMRLCETGEAAGLRGGVTVTLGARPAQGRALLVAIIAIAIIIITIIASAKSGLARRVRPPEAVLIGIPHALLFIRHARPPLQLIRRPSRHDRPGGAMTATASPSTLVRRPPVHGKPPLNVIHQQRHRQHQRAAQHDDGQQKPPDLHQPRVHDGQQSRRPGRGVHRLGQAHEDGREGTREGAAHPLKIGELVAELQELGDSHSGEGGDELADDGIPGLCQWRFDGVEFQDGSCALVCIGDGV